MPSTPATYGLPPDRHFSGRSAQPPSQQGPPYFSSPGYAPALSQNPVSPDAPRSVPGYFPYQSQGFPQPSYLSQPQYSGTLQYYPPTTGGTNLPPRTPESRSDPVPSPRHHQTVGQLSSYQLPPIRPAVPPTQAPQALEANPFHPQPSGQDQRLAQSRQHQQRAELAAQSYQPHPQPLANPRAAIGQSIAQQQLTAEGQHREEQDSSPGPQTKRQKMHLGEILGPRDE